MGWNGVARNKNVINVRKTDRHAEFQSLRLWYFKKGTSSARGVMMKHTI